jgi:hypothetical protein
LSTGTTLDLDLDLIFKELRNRVQHTQAMAAEMERQRIK